MCQTFRFAARSRTLRQTATDPESRRSSISTLLVSKASNSRATSCDVRKFRLSSPLLRMARYFRNGNERPLANIADNRAQFDSILCRHHNKVAPKEQEKTPKYFAESTHSLRISQKFSNIKGKLKEAGTEIHLTLPRRSRSFGEKQLKQLQDNDSWAKFLKLNKAAGNKSNK